MINRTGYTSVIKNGFQPSFSPKKSSKGSNSPLSFGIVSRISFNSSDENYYGVGTIEFSNFNGEPMGTALPIFSNSSFKYPALGDMVLIIRNSLINNDEGIGTNNFYFPPINLWGNPNSNIYSSIPGLFGQNQYPPYIKSNIHPLYPYTLDNITQGGFGNSIRLGSTNKTEPTPNTWSTSGEEYSPIMILMNGQDPTNTSQGDVPIVEDINKDLSSIYLTSTQQIPFSLAREEFSKWKIAPTTPSSYTNPQIILNSDRVIINAKSESILISSKQSIGLSCSDEINLIGNNIIIDGGSILLGDKSATEPILLGNKTVNTLSQILTQLIGLCSLLEVSQIFPGGVPVPDAPMNAMASNAKSKFESLQNQINSLKSNISKTK